MDVVTELQSNQPKLIKISKRFGSCCCYTEHLCRKLTNSWIEFVDMPDIPCCSEECFQAILLGMKDVPEVCVDTHQEVVVELPIEVPIPQEEQL